MFLLPNCLKTVSAIFKYVVFLVYKFQFGKNIKPVVCVSVKDCKSVEPLAEE